MPTEEEFAALAARVTSLEQSLSALIQRGFDEQLAALRAEIEALKENGE